MLISEFADTTGLSVDTVRYYIRRGLLVPELGAKGGANPYQMFTRAHVDAARAIRTAQALGFSLKDIAALASDYRAGLVAPDRGASILQDQLAQLEDQADKLARMIRYMRAKLNWIRDGEGAAEPRIQDFLRD